jgi:2-dehydro-3-deoxygluconokinase
MDVSTPRPIEVVCLGETMGQIVPAGGASVRTAKTFKMHHAGAESNVAVGLSRLGHSVAWVSRLGNDAIGLRIADALEREGVRVLLEAEETSGRTGLFVKDPANGVSYYRADSAASRMDRQDVVRALEATPRVLHLSGITAALSPSCDDAIAYALATAKKRGIVTSFDVNYRAALWPSAAIAADRLLELASASDVVFVGLDEANTLWETDSEHAVRELLPSVPRLVVKDGSRGAIEFVGEQFTEVMALVVNVVEVVGAGDAFAAGYLSAFLQGATSVSALRAGHLMARNALGSRSDFGRKIDRSMLTVLANDPALWPTTDESPDGRTSHSRGAAS